MTTIIIHKNSTGMYKGFTCIGHAGYRKILPDIVCSSISVLVINTVNSLEELCGEQFTTVTNEKTGFIKCDFENPLQEKSVLLLDSMVFGLQNISQKYGEKYLLVKFEEV